MRVLFDGFNSHQRWILRRMLGNQLFEVAGIVDDLDDESFEYLLRSDSGRESYRGEIDFREGSVSLSGRYGRGGVRFDEVPRARSWEALRESRAEPVDLVVTSSGARPGSGAARVIDLTPGSAEPTAVAGLVTPAAPAVAPAAPHLHAAIALLRALQKTVGMSAAAWSAADVPEEFASGSPGRAATLPDTGGSIVSTGGFSRIGALLEEAGGGPLRDGISGVEFISREAGSCATLVLSAVVERAVSPAQLVRLLGSETKRSLPRQYEVSAGLRNDDLRSRPEAVLDPDSIQVDGNCVSFAVRLDPHAFYAEAVTRLSAG